jgi:hypothetical protein
MVVHDLTQFRAESPKQLARVAIDIDGAGHAKKGLVPRQEPFIFFPRTW